MALFDNTVNINGQRMKIVDFKLQAPSTYQTDEGKVVLGQQVYALTDDGRLFCRAFSSARNSWNKWLEISVLVGERT